MELDAHLFEEKAALLKALAHPLRLRIVRGLLVCGCRNVSCMEERRGSPSPASPSTSPSSAPPASSGRNAAEMRYTIP